MRSRSNSRPMAIGLALLASTSSAAAALPRDFRANADAYIDAAWPSEGPGGAIVIMEKGKIVYERAGGLADMEKRTPITPSTVFRMGSITKQFAAAVIMQLVDERKLSLDDRVSKFIPGYPQPGGSATVRQLLNHTSGIQPYTSVPGFMTESNISRPHSTSQMIAAFKDLPPVTPPGEAWAYNNSGYILIGAIIEKVTGQSWHEVVQERFATPLNLPTIRYGVEESAVPNMAKGYTVGEKGPVLASKLHLSVPHAAGGLIGSARDLAKWSQALHHGKVVSRDSYAQMIAPTRMPDGKHVEYGFGLAPGKIRGQAAIGHGGGINGFTTDSVYIPDQDLFVAVFANSMPPTRSPSIVMRRLAALALGQPYPLFEKANVKPTTLEPLTGMYREEGNTGSKQDTVFVRNGTLFLQPEGQPELKLDPAGGDRFFPGQNSLTWLQFRRDPAGSHQMTVRHADDKPRRFTRTGAAPAEAPPFKARLGVLESYVGRYKSEHFIISIYLDDAGQPYA